MNDFELKEKIFKARFKKNNARVLRGINVLRTEFINLSDLKPGLAPDITEKEYYDSINYLYESGLIHIRNKNSHESTSLADTKLNLLEAKLNAKGIQLINGAITDPCIDDL